MSGHTLGPWAWVMTRRFDGSGKRMTLVAPNQKDPADGLPPQRLASLEMDCADPKDAKANASLIAAAPDLLEALKRVLDTNNGGPHGENIEGWLDARRDAVVALIKADGSAD